MYQDVFDDRKQVQMRNCFLHDLAPMGIVKCYRKKQAINPSFCGPALAIVTSGKVCKSIISLQGSERLLYTLRPGEIFGEMNLFCGGNLNYVIRAKEDSEVSFIGADALQKILGANPSIYQHVINSITRKNRILLLQLTSASFNDALGRIADTLLRLAACSDTMVREYQPQRITTLFTHEELAQNVGCSRITVTRVLKKFVQESLIAITNKQIVIHDIEGLAAYTDRVQ